MTHGLYDPNDDRDNCGFGLIAHLHGEASHQLVRTAIEALASMTHRGGIAADGRTGDGCGLLLQKPDLFLRRAAQTCGAGELTPLYGADCPVAIVVKASWPDERVVRGTLADIADKVAEEPIERTALIFVGHTLAAEDFRESSLYDPAYQRRFRDRGD